MLAVISVLMSLGGCDRGGDGTASVEARPVEHVITYVVRGRIVELPDPTQPQSDLRIAHEEIPDFRREDGTLGMNAMVMPFPLGPGVSLAGLSVDDKVEVTFDVRYEQPDPASERWRLKGWNVTKIEPLDPSVQLAL